jgi:hypothetical protein
MAPKVSQVPESLRADLERSGEAVVAHRLAIPYAYAVGTVGVPEWVATEDQRQLVLSALVPASIAGSMKDEIFQAASNTLRTVAVRRRKWNLR